ncbi:hypothetical protein AB205_0220260 [Aquarana catesbeiana]|uniref:CP2H1 protein n=1 Tax=Aquarana catesbeiana TaxID=8400 RepID=A0A2G9RL97_AQUCT|nr:hypothetical protein AB205_0220260 [Aquarana catesbeiana]PIO27994.1 hypothetical protein AB205_0220260 [Aquarana catesbeiana]
MPFTDAVIHEMQRFIDLIPMGVARKTTRDVEFRGYYIPKRNCMGEALARMEIFLLVVTILQNFALEPELPREDLDLRPDVSGIGNLPKPYKMAFIPR